MHLLEAEFNFTPLMFWEDITYVLQLIAKFFKKIFGLDKNEDEGTAE